MERVIKFKYWNTISNIMVNNPTMPYKEGWTIEQLFSDRGWIWLQYIGLKDRNEKEIYEGDIYICNQPLVKSGKQIYKEHIRIIENTISEHYKVLCLSESDEGIEIIGNKFEHPELLNKKQ